jgi:hypothetical protein
MDKLHWTDDRILELEALRRLLDEAKSLNHGSDVVNRILNLERIADSLTRLDISVPRDNFIQFLTDLCVEERSKFKANNEIIQ